MSTNPKHPKHILDLVAAMERARNNGRTDDEQELANRKHISRINIGHRIIDTITKEQAKDGLLSPSDVCNVLAVCLGTLINAMNEDDPAGLGAILFKVVSLITTSAFEPRLNQ